MEIVRIILKENNEIRELTLEEISEFQKEGYELEVRLVRKESVKNVSIEITTKEVK